MAYQYPYQQPYQQLPYPPVDPAALYDGARHPDDLARPLYGATFMDAIRRFFRMYATFTGRASRSEYWWMQLALGLFNLIPLVVVMIGWATMLGGIATTSSYGSSSGAAALPGFGVMMVGLALTGVISLGLIVPTLALSWRRLHDANYAGPMYFLSFIPYVGSLIVLIFMVLGSKPEGRRFDLPR